MHVAFVGMTAKVTKVCRAHSHSQWD